MRQIIPLSDLAVTSVEVAECGEELVDLGDGELVRAGVAGRLSRVRAALPDGLRLLVVGACGSAGAAVDVTLCSAAREELDMGTPVRAAGGDACHTTALRLSDAAVRNREVLIRAMTAAGFVNYPARWWHWSYGDRYWAYTLGMPSARYGP
ncbi:M15 family metallopeptidase [Nonomuraea ceibae]|uniref:M15 family metallopeptidase n=1 Tax=Nonomuraea ceibae TaxID=1935170 RepID=UPI001C5ED5E3|nr:M15 family metallopeptidase [Nonomuraea ceibae]